MKTNRIYSFLGIILALSLFCGKSWGATSYTYRLVVSKAALVDGKRYLLLVNNRTTAYNCSISSGHLSTGVTFTAGGTSAGSAITTTTAASSIKYVTLIRVSGDTYKIYDSGGKYVTATEAKSGSFSRANSDSYGWTFTGTTGMNARYQEKNKQAYCRSYNNSTFRSYANTSSGAVFYLATGCSVTYNANGATSGTVPADAYLYGEGATVTVKSNSGSLAKSGGYTFSGWNTKADGSGTNYTAGSGTFTISKDTVLYAKWTAACTDQDVIAFDGDTGSEAYEEEVDYGSDPISLSVLSDGTGTVTWFSDDTDVATVTGDRDGATVTIVGAGSATITASVAAGGGYCAGSGDYELTVNAIAPTLSHNTTGKALTVSSITSTGATFSGGVVTNKGGADITKYGFTIGTSSTVVIGGTGANAPVASGLWNDDIALNTAFGSKTSVSNFSPNTTYYVRAFAYNGTEYGYSDAVEFTTLQRYAISYNNNGGSGSMDGAYKDHGVSFTLPSNAGDMSKTGYHIADWKLGSSSGTSYALGGSYTTNEAATFYAGWVANTYTVTFDKNGGGTGTGTTDQDFTYGTAQNLNACGFTAPTDKYFLGWDTDKDATTATYADEANVNNLTTDHEGTVKLYAIWKDYSYTNYRTSCCTELGTIGGAVNYSNPTTAVLTWNDMSNVDATTPYTITYRTGSDEFDDDNVGSITTNGAGKKTCTITGLSCNTNYDFKIAVTAASGYCDKEEVLEDQNSGKWSVSYTLTDDHTTKTDGPSAGANVCGDFEATFEAVTGYLLPSTITVTIGGESATAGTDYTWTKASGELEIAASKITGNIAITITADEKSCNVDPTVGNPTLTSIVSGKMTVSCASIGSGTGCEIKDYGFYYKSGGDDPTTSDTKAQVGTNDQSTAFSKEISIDFTTGITYKFKAYATNDKPATVLSSTSLTVVPRSITFDSKGGSSVTTQYTNSGTPTTKPSDPTKAGYTFSKWQLSSSDYDFSSNVSENITLDAVWTANTFYVRFNKNNASATGTMSNQTFSYGTAQNLTTNAFKLTGYKFQGWATTSDGDVAHTDGKSVSNLTSTNGATVDLYAIWALSTTTVSFDQREGTGGQTTTKTATYGSAMPTPITCPTRSGYFFAGYYDSDGKQYYTSDGASAATWDKEDATCTLYAHWFGDAIAWCDPDVEVTGDVHLTSTKDMYVHSTSGAGNLIAVASTELGSATSIEVGYLDGSDDEVDKASSPFRLYESDASATVDEVDVSASRTFSSTNYSIRYTPSAYGVTNNYKLQLKLKKGDKVLKTITHAIYGRGLPEEFVIAVKKDAQWYALPNTILNNTSAVKPTKIRVDNETTPTAATYTANTTVYKATGRNTEGSNIYGIRFTDPDGHWLQVSSTAGTNYVWTSTTNSDDQQVWMLQTNNFGAYTMTLPTYGGATDKQFGINNLGNMGFYASDAANLCKEVYLLPITNKYTEIAATVSEWGEHGVIVQPETPSDLALVASASMNIGTNDPEAATTTAINAAYGTAKRVKVDDNDGDLDIGVIENEGKSLFIHWKNGSGTEIGVSQVTIPTVIATSADMYSIATTKAAWAAKSEVYVLPGATLTANAGSFSGEGALSVSNLHLYPGATLNVSTGTFNASTLRLHNGWTRAGTKKYDVARVYIADDAALTKTTASMDYDIYESSEGRHFYPLAVPFPVAVSAINYADSWLAGFSEYGMEGQYVIKEYDGARRAEKGPDQVNNWTPIASDATLSPGKGYIMTAIPVYGEAIIRVPLTFGNAWTADGEKATVSDVTKNVVSVTAYSGTAAGDKKVNKGWNLLGVPFMSCYTTSAGMYADEGSATVIQGKFNFEDGTWDSEDKVRYVNVPVHDFSEYVQTDITDDDTKLLPGWCFFVQIETSGNLKFLTAQQAQNSSLPIYAPKLEDSPVVKTGIILSDGEKSDKTTFLISDKYSAEYEIGEDLEKMFGSAFTLSTYSMMNNTKLAYNALSPDEAKLAIPVGVRIPEDGEYTFSLNPRYEEANIERLDLIDYETSQITNLMTDSYTFTMTQGENTERFALNVTMRKETPTGLENGVNDANDANGANRVRKLIINEKLYILRDGMIFDATGKRVTEINK